MIGQRDGNQEASCCGFLAVNSGQAKYYNPPNRQISFPVAFHGWHQNTPRRDTGEGTANQTDAIAQALNKLSMKERDEVYRAIHGIVDDDVISEDYLFVENRLKELDVQLSLTAGPNSAYSKALRISPSSAAYVKNRDFLIMFLRADEWNAKLASKRMIKFLEHKWSLFGPDKLAKSIRLDDLDEEDQAALESGFLQHIPLRDRSGRDMVAIRMPHTGNIPPKSLLRAFYFVFMSIAEGNVQTQQRGLVEISYQVSLTTYRNDSSGAFKMLLELRPSLPLKVAAVHMCTDDPAIRMFVTAIRRWLPLEHLCRIRIHCGPHMEMLYELLSYGIPIAVLPIDTEGNWHTTYHQSWLRKQLEMIGSSNTTNGNREVADSKDDDVMYSDAVKPDPEPPVSLSPIPAFENQSFGENGSESMVVPQPECRDVLFGRGRFVDNRPANVQFRRWLAQHLEQYEEASRIEKTEIAERLLRGLKSNNVRFLRQLPDGKGWQEADDKTVREKISRTFRRIRESKKAADER